MLFRSIPIDSQLAILQRYIDQYSIAGSRLFHLQLAKNFSRPVQRVDIPATPFDEYPDLTTGALLSLLYGSHDQLFLLRIKKLLPGKKWDLQDFSFSGLCD